MKIQMQNIFRLDEYHTLSKPQKTKIKIWTAIAIILGLPLFIVGGVAAGILTFNYLSKKYSVLDISNSTSKAADTAKKVDSVVKSDNPVVYTVEGMPMMDKRAVGLLYRMQKDWDEVCQNHNIRYFACSGTLMGVERHNPPGIIPWDDDIDVALPLNEEEKFKNKEFNDDLLARGLKLRPHWGGFKLTLLECPSFGTTYGTGRPNGEFYWPFIDVFHTFKSEKDGFIYINCRGEDKERPDEDKTVWPREKWLESDFSEIERVPFGPNTIPVQKNNRTEYLNRAYGTDWSTTARQMFDHKTGVHFNPAKVVQIKDFSPAPYDETIFNAPLPKSAE